MTLTVDDGAEGAVSRVPPRQGLAASTVMLGLGGYLAGVGVLVAGTASPLASFRAMIEQPAEAVLWCFLIAAEVGLWAALVPTLSQTLGDYRHTARMRRWRFLGIVLAIVLVFGTLLFSRAFPALLTFPIAYHFEKVKILTAIGFVPFAASLSGMYLVGAAAEERPIEGSAYQRETLTLMQLHDDLQRLLTASGLIIGAATLSTGVLQQAVHALNSAPGLFKPNALYALLYGAFGTAVIVLLYLPAYTALHAAGVRLCDRILPLPPDVNDIKDWYERRLKLTSLIGQDKTAFESLKAGVAIISPLIAGATSYLALK